MHNEISNELFIEKFRNERQRIKKAGMPFLTKEIFVFLFHDLALSMLELIYNHHISKNKIENLTTQNRRGWKSKHALEGKDEFTRG